MGKQWKQWQTISWAPKSLQKVNAVIKLKDTCSLKEGFPDSSVGKESACNAEDPSLIPGSGRSAGEGIGYALQYSWASFVAQLVKNPPAMQETWVRSLCWENPGEGNSYPLQYSGLENSMDCVVHGVTKSQTRLSDRTELNWTELKPDMPPPMVTRLLVFKANMELGRESERGGNRVR